MVKWLVFAGLGGLAYHTLTTRKQPGVSLGCRGAVDLPLARALARKWGRKFGCPEEIMLVIGKIESGYRPNCANVNARALQRGGAWGMFQQTWGTAKGHASALASSTDPEIRATMRRWSGLPTALLDPDLNAMFAARQLGNLYKRYGGDFEATVAAYHQGAGKVDKMRQLGQRIPEDLPPYGKIYVTRALKARVA